jgi:MoaA/NifB/PqqE/SkfB family radical SAM enzyme
MLKKIYDSLFDKTRNKVQYISGIRKSITDLYIIGTVLKNHPAKLLRNLKTKIKRIPKFSATFQNHKYVYFNGSMFMDAFSPKWPGNPFNRTTGNLLDILNDRSFNWERFTLALIFAITKKCVYRCEHCYAIQTLGSKEVLTLDNLMYIAKAFVKLGGSVISWEGGEPTLRFEDLLTLINQTRGYIDSWLATTAYGLTYEKAQKLKNAGICAAIISLDHYDREVHNKFRGNDKAYDMAVNGVRIFRETGILPNICICATRETIDEGDLYRYLELAKKLEVGFVEILDATPSGNYIGQDVSLTNKQLDVIKKFHIDVNTNPEYKDYPSISARPFLESDSHYGCVAGNGHFYMDSSGNVQACDLLQISFGNVIKEGFIPVYRRMKEFFPHFFSGRCPAQTLAKLIAKVYEEHQSLPLPYEKCQHILDLIKKRGIPQNLEL